MIKDLHSLIAAAPFIPFSIYTADGTQIRVPTVDHIAIAPKGPRIVVFADDGSLTHVSALLIAGLVVDPAPVQA